MKIFGILALVAVLGSSSLMAGCSSTPGGSGQLGDSCGDLGWGKIGGTLAGAAGGAYVGSRLSGAGRSTQTAATAIGAVAGAAAGFFAGRSIDRGLCEQAAYARNAALQAPPHSAPITWQDSQGYGQAQTLRTGNQNGRVCKEVETTYTTTAGETIRGVSIGCQRPDGRYDILPANS